jgi:hypothetical protein
MLSRPGAEHWDDPSPGIHAPTHFPEESRNESGIIWHVINDFSILGCPTPAGLKTITTLPNVLDRCEALVTPSTRGKSKPFDHEFCNGRGQA